MANEYLLKKWRLWFKVLDRRHAGQITREDEKRDEESFVKLTHLEGERKEQALETSHSLWNEFIFHGKAGPVTEKEFVDLTNEDYKNDKVKFVEKMRRACVEDLKILDQSGEGSLTEEEFINAYKSAGLVDESWNKNFFQALGPVDGKVSTDVLCEAWVQYFTSDDSSQKDIVQNAFETYPNL